MNDALRLRRAEQRALDFAVRHDFTGTDPYDGLLSPAAPLLPGLRGRQAWVQLHKRGGTRLRSLTGVPQVTMTKALALFVQGTALTDRTDLSRRLADRVLESKGTGPWGYEFDVQTRWAHYLAGSPNVVATVFTLRSLAAAGRLADVGDRAGEWLASLADSGGHLRYTEASDRLVHNGNLLAAEGIELLGGDSDIVRSAVASTLERQRGDGSWPYGEGGGLEWIDNFHTVYNLESLLFLRDRGYDVGDSIERGYRFWVEHCLTYEGLPTYFADDIEASRDVHNVATTVGFLARVRSLGWESPDPGPATGHLLSMQGADGGFRNSAQALPHMRWNQGHAYLALARWVREDNAASGAHEGARTDDGGNA